MATTTRVYNFSSGPAVLPLSVLEEVQRDLLALPGVGISILEISHRSKAFDAIIHECEDNVRKLAAIPDNYRILFISGGATLQFSMVPLNFLAPGETADYIVTGSWSKKALKEAQKVGAANVAFTDEPESFIRCPSRQELNLTPKAAYVHMTGNETIHGVEFNTLPEVGDVPLVNDASSHLLSRPIDFTRFAFVYAGAQKNLGPAGCALAIIRDDMVKKAEASPAYGKLPVMLQYGVYVADQSLHNTPPVFAIYVMNLVTRWLVNLGGLAAIEKVNIRKANKVYAEIDRTGFYRGHARKEDRSRMNLTFRLPNEELEARFIKESTAEGLDGLKGHRSVGGIRASLYNAFPEEGVDALVSFMREFERRNG